LLKLHTICAVKEFLLVELVHTCNHQVEFLNDFKRLRLDGTKRVNDKIGSLLKSKKHEDFQLFAQLLTAIDKSGVEALKHKDLTEPKKVAFRIGITGPPGAGKSTLISGLIQEFRKQKLKVGVLAVDPSSPFSHGALLGDRIRYAEALNDSEVFVRSIGSRGSPGGLSASSYLLLKGFDAWDFDIVIVETVGVGQTELEVVNVADHVSVVLVPESGDGIQLMKAGLMEIANSFIVNKSDRPGADSLANELAQSLKMDDKQTPIFPTVATEKTGVEKVAAHFLEIRLTDFRKNRYTIGKIRAEGQALLRFRNEKKIQEATRQIRSVKDLAKLFV